MIIADSRQVAWPLEMRVHRPERLRRVYPTERLDRLLVVAVLASRWSVVYDPVISERPCAWLVFRRRKGRFCDSSTAGSAKGRERLARRGSSAILCVLIRRVLLVAARSVRFKSRAGCLGRLTGTAETKGA